MTDQPSSPEVRRGFMCVTDFECELGHALGGSKVYPDIEDLLENHNCGDGIAEVEVRLVRVTPSPNVP